MMNKFVTLFSAILLIAGITSISVHAGPLNPLRDRITTSETYRLPAGTLHLSRNLEIPDCRSSEFMFQQVVAYPKPLLTAGFPGSFDVDLGAWYVLVPLGQPESGGSEAGVQLYLYGSGYETAKASIRPGQAVLESISTAYPSVEVPVVIVEGSAAAAHEFVVHLSGRCKDPFVLSVPSSTD